MFPMLLAFLDAANKVNEMGKSGQGAASGVSEATPSVQNEVARQTLAKAAHPFEEAQAMYTPKSVGLTNEHLAPTATPGLKKVTPEGLAVIQKQAPQPASFGSNLGGLAARGEFDAPAIQSTQGMPNPVQPMPVSQLMGAKAAIDKDGIVNGLKKYTGLSDMFSSIKSI